MVKDTNIFGLMGHNADTPTAFVSFRGSSDVADWVADFEAVPENYVLVSGSETSTPASWRSTKPSARASPSS
jgi:hypothetical protein